MARNYPKVGRVYTYEEIQGLDLRDDPFFMVAIDGDNDWHPVQDSHLEQDDYSLFAGSTWKYIKETSEWIPIFHLVEGFQWEIINDLNDSYYPNKVIPKGTVSTYDWTLP